MTSPMSAAAAASSTQCEVELTHPQLALKGQAVKATLGCPVSGVQTDLFGEGLYVELEHGAIFWPKNAPESYALSGKILDKFWDLGGPGGQLGYPVSDLTTTPYSQGQVARFEKGAISVLPGKAPVVTIALPGFIWR
jgi:uncharacterized protein with LGFP repeats